MGEAERLAWKTSSTGSIAGVASIRLGADTRYLDAQNTRRFLELNGNPPRDGFYTVAPRDYSWFAIFGFERSGYVKDDEKIDPDQLLSILKEGNAKAQDERKRLGLEQLNLVGWFVPPHYDVETRRLEWGTRLRTESGSSIVNYSSRILGRSGVINATLVSDPENLENDVVAFKNSLKGFEFNLGERYAEFKAGDKVAEYGLAALIVGGAAAAAAKSGAGKAIGKFLMYGLFAAGAVALGFLKKLFGRKG
jgi:uncharacterized membrane-anchored protein